MIKNSIKAIGKTIRCMEGVFLNGLMEEYMMEIMQMIKSMALEEFVGPMAESMRENGKMGLSMVKANIKEGTGFGSRVVGSLENV